MPIPALLAPFIAKLAENGLSMLVGAVTSKGKEVIEENLGVDIEKSLETPEGKLKLRQLEIEHEEFLISAAKDQALIDLEYVKEANKNTQGARGMNEGIQNSVNASTLAKNAAYILDFVIVGMTLLMGFIIMFQAIPTVNKEIFFTTFGSLITLCGTIVNFHRGTSSGSKDNAEHARKLTNEFMKDKS